MTLFSSKPFNFSKTLFFGVVLNSQQNERKYIEIYIFSNPHKCKDSPIINIPYQNNTFTTIDKPKLIHHNQSNYSNIVVHSIGLEKISLYKSLKDH